MLLTLIFLSTLLLVLVILLVRQTGLTRQAVEETQMWKRLYQSAYLKREAAARKSGQVREKNTSAAHSQPTKSATRRRSKTKEYRGKTAQTAPLIAEKVNKVPERLTLVLPIQLLSKNARDKLHYQAKNKLRKDYQDIIQIKYPRRGEPTPRVRQRATVTRILGPRERRFDQQNVGAGSAIELIDALTRAGFWVDDSETWLETRFEQAANEKVRGPAVTVEIIALETT